MTPAGKLKRAEATEELRAAGVTENDHGPVDKQPLPVLHGMVWKIREDQRARREGAGDCGRHPGQTEGVCPLCSGVWAEI